MFEAIHPKYECSSLPPSLQRGLISRTAGTLSIANVACVHRMNLAAFQLVQTRQTPRELNNFMSDEANEHCIAFSWSPSN